MRIVRAVACVVIVLLLAACGPNSDSDAPSAKEKEEDLFGKALNLFAQAGSDDSGWSFTVTDGENGLAFAKGWPLKKGAWQAYPFAGKDAPHALDEGALTEVWFDVPLGDSSIPLEASGLLADLAEPGKMAMQVAKQVLRGRGTTSHRLGRKEREVLRAVAEGRMVVSYQPKAEVLIRHRVIYRGARRYSLFHFGSVVGANGWTALCVWRGGFIAAWGPSFGNEVAYYYDGRKLIAILKAEVDSPRDRKDALQDMLSNINQFISVVEAAGLGVQSETLQQARLASDILSNEEPVWVDARDWFYMDELLEQMLTGGGLSPPIERFPRELEKPPATVEFDADGVDVYFSDYHDWEWGMILSSEEWQFTPSAVPSGLVMGYLKRLGEGGSILTCVVSEVPLGGELSDDVEEAVTAVSGMAKSVLASEGHADRLNAKAVEALRSISERKLTVTSSGPWTTSFSERTSAGGSEMMYTVNLPSQEVVLHFHAKRTSAALEFIPAFKDVQWRVTLDRGKLALVSTQDSLRDEIGSQVKDAAADLRRMRDAGLLEVPAFASAMTKQFIAKVGASRRYDGVRSVQPGEIRDMGAW